MKTELITASVFCVLAIVGLAFFPQAEPEKVGSPIIFERLEEYEKAEAIAAMDDATLEKVEQWRCEAIAREATVDTLPESSCAACLAAD